MRSPLGARLLSAVAITTRFFRRDHHLETVFKRYLFSVLNEKNLFCKCARSISYKRSLTRFLGDNWFLKLQQVNLKISRRKNFNLVSLPKSHQSPNGVEAALPNSSSNCHSPSVSSCQSSLQMKNLFSAVHSLTREVTQV